MRYGGKMQIITDIEQFNTYLNKAGVRSSKTRRQIFAFLLKATEPLSIQHIIKAVDSHFVSVYRSIDVLAKVGVIKRVPIGLKYKYELSDDFKPHHHHATCEKCGRTFTIASASVENVMNEVTRGAGLEPTRHYFEVYGICSRH